MEEVLQIGRATIGKRVATRVIVVGVPSLHTAQKLNTAKLLITCVYVGAMFVGAYRRIADRSSRRFPRNWILPMSHRSPHSER